MMTNINNPFEFFDFQKMLAALKVPTVDGNSENLINAQNYLKATMRLLKSK